MASKLIRYTLVSPSGDVKSGHIKHDELESILNLANEGYEILELEEEVEVIGKPIPRVSAPQETPDNTSKQATKNVPPRVRRRRLPTYELKLFTQNIAELLNAGVSLLESLNSIRQADDGPLGEFCEKVAGEIQSGQTFSNAMARSGFYLDPTFIGLVKAGEESGQLALVLKQLNERVMRVESLKRSFIQASIYPLSLVFASILLLLFVGYFVVPSILPVILALTQELPLPTKILLVFYNHSWKFGLLLMVVLSCLPWLWSSNPAAVSVRQWLKYESPLFGRFARTQAITQFCSDFALLLDSGVPMVKALGLIHFDDRTLERSKRRVVKNIINGDSLSQALETELHFPRILTSLILMAEESGANLPQTLKHQADLLEMEAEESRQAIAKLFEPVLVGVMGLIVGFVLLAIFLPIYGQLASGL